MALNVIEIAGFQGYLGDALPDAGYVYNVGLIALFAVLSHLALWVAFEEPPAVLRRSVVPLMYAYLLLLCILLGSSRLVIVGFEWLGGYTITRIPGPLYPLFEIFAVCTLLAVLVLPIRGIRQKSDGRLRSRCQLWTLAAMPSGLLVIAVLALLRMDLKYFNATVTLPIPMALLLMAVGYCVHSNRIIELSSYLPFTKNRRTKHVLHTSLAALAMDAPRMASLKELLDRLSSAIDCPAYLVGVDGLICASTEIDTDLIDLPLADIRETLVARETTGSLKQKMAQYRLGAIVPLFSTSDAARSWLVFGKAFEAKIYTPSDFQMLDRVVKQLAGLLLDQLALSAEERPALVHPTKQAEPSADHQTIANSDLIQPLAERLAHYEAFLIAEALKCCDGNKAKAARLLGLQPNTLHYKLRRLNLPAQKK